MTELGRKYRIRNKLVELEEVPGTVAVRGEQAGEAVEGIEGQASFERGGWRFLRRPASEKSVPGEAFPHDGARVLRKRETGQLVLDLNRATVKFENGVPEQQVREILGQKGAMVLRRLPVAPNVYQVQFAPDRDVFDAVAELQALPDVEFAEPELIEAIGKR